MVISHTNITITKPLLTCPACEKDIEAETVVSFDGPSGPLITGGKTVNLNGQVVGIKLQHDCTPKATQRRGRPPGTKNKPKPETPPSVRDEITLSRYSDGTPVRPKVEPDLVRDGKTSAEVHRDRLREHEATQDSE